MKHLSGILAPSRLGLGRFLVFALACLLLADANASERPAAMPAGSEIRSAQLSARDGRWQSVVPRSAGDERAEIRAHFAAVRRILIQNTPISLGIAVTRFEQAFNLSLTPERRTDLLGKLAARRGVQLERLADYARAGRFPLNRHYAGEARPIFVDARGTHCAVGHLMAMDGLEPDVLAIARAKPNVLVREMADGPLVAWMLTSGLIQEEAALIQPAYFPPDPSSATKLGDLVVPGGVLDRNGFRYENFGFSASSSGGAVTPVASQFVLVPGFTGPGFICPPQCFSGQDAIWFGVFGSTYFSYLSTATNQSITVNIDYDVVALLEDLAVGGATTFETSYTGGFGRAGLPNPFGEASIASDVDGDTSGVLDLLLTNDSYTHFGFGEDSASAYFATPTSRVHVHHSIQLADGASFSSFDSLILRPVPLPTMAPLLVLAFGVLGRYFRRSRG